MIDEIRDSLERKGYAFFSRGDWNLNIIGIRSAKRDADLFDDRIICVYKVGGVWRHHSWPATTDPGSRYLANPINDEGCAILVPGQYRGCYKIGKHRGYEALVQSGSVNVWRDDNRDNVLDWGDGPGNPGYYGINIHREADKVKEPARNAKYVSAGCQVFAVPDEHRALIEIATKSARLYGNSFTYTLIEEGDL